MIVQTHRALDKKLKKIDPYIKDKFKTRLILFVSDQFHPLLNNHALSGNYEGYRSINVTGNYRAVFKLMAQDLAIFYDIDTHPKLYRS